MDFPPAPIDRDNGIKFAFFKPFINPITETKYSLSIVVIFWIDKTDSTFSVRLEPSGGRLSAHGYAHLQFTRQIKLENEAVTTSQQDWLPDSYPAFALAYEHSVHYFAGLAMSLHGFSVDDASRFAAKTLTKALEANRSRKLLAEMKRVFGRDWPNEAAAAAS